MEYIVVKSQAELDAVPVDTDKTIRIEFGTAECPAVVSKRYRNFVNACGDSTVKAYNNSLVEAQDSSYVEAYNNSHVVAWGTSTVIAYNNSFVEAWGSYVEAYDSSTVRALRRSTVRALGRSTIEAYERSSVMALDRSYVEAYNNSIVEARVRSYVAAWDSSSVEAWNSSAVAAWDSSSVIAYDNSHVEAYNNSIVEACGNSTVAACGNSTVAACGNSTVAAWNSSSVVARGNSFVEAQDRSTVEAWGNVQIYKTESFSGEIKTHANARVVVMPKSVDEFLNFYGISSDEPTVFLYNAVHKIDEAGTIRFVSHYDKAFEYKIGEKICSYGFDMNSDNACSQGIHVANLNRALDFGASWDDLAILELKVYLLDIVIPDDSNGEVRVPEALVVREVPLEDCGVYGKILSKRRKNSEMRNSN